MASPAIIAEILRQAYAERNKPSATQQSLANLLQVMQGVAQGIQIYDAMKSLPYKYGTPAKTVKEVIPGTEAIPASSPEPRTLPGIGPSYGVDSLIAPAPRTLPGIGPVRPEIPGTPPTTIERTIPGQPGSLALDAISKLKDFTGPGVESIMSSILKPYGMEGSISPAPTPILAPNAEGNLQVNYYPRGTKIAPPSMLPTTVLPESSVGSGITVPGGQNVRVVDTTPKGPTKEETRTKALDAAFEEAYKTSTKGLTAEISGVDWKTFIPLYKGVVKQRDPSITEEQLDKAILPYKSVLEQREKSRIETQKKMRSSLDPTQIDPIIGVIKQAKATGDYDETLYRKSLLRRGFSDDEITYLLNV